MRVIIILPLYLIAQIGYKRASRFLSLQLFSSYPSDLYPKYLYNQTCIPWVEICINKAST